MNSGQEKQFSWRWPILFGSVAAIPAWLLSVILHLSIAIILALVVTVSPQGAIQEPSREGGIVLKYRDEHGDRYEGQEDHQEEAAGGGLAQQTAEQLQKLLNQPAPVDLSEVLPNPADIVGPGATAPSLPASASELTQGAGPQSAGGLGSKLGYARTNVFGVEGEGNKFVYVFDRSASMSQPQGRPLRAAKQELQASLSDLGDVQQFHIIFYNQEPWVFDPGGVAGRLVFANEQNKNAAYRFIEGISADGGTNHMQALQAALRMRPDVIFLLTDGDDKDDLTVADLAVIRRRNAGASIHVIQFASRPVGTNNLVQMAKENGGQHVFVDISSR